MNGMECDADRRACARRSAGAVFTRSPVAMPAGNGAFRSSTDRNGTCQRAGQQDEAAACAVQSDGRSNGRAPDPRFRPFRRTAAWCATCRDRPVIGFTSLNHADPFDPYRLTGKRLSTGCPPGIGDAAPGYNDRAAFEMNASATSNHPNYPANPRDGDRSGTGSGDTVSGTAAAKSTFSDRPRARFPELRRALRHAVRDFIRDRPNIIPQSLSPARRLPGRGCRVPDGLERSIGSKSRRDPEHSHFRRPLRRQGNMSSSRAHRFSALVPRPHTPAGDYRALLPRDE